MALEARGVRVAALRRETAAIVASEIPTAASNGSPSPHRSDELADVLRAAFTVAARRNAAAGTDDLMQVFSTNARNFRRPNSLPALPRVWRCATATTRCRR